MSGWKRYSETPRARTKEDPPAPALRDPARYFPDAKVVEAVNVALLLRQPLLLTGDPGTGKTELAASVAYQLGLPEPIVFHTKTTSTARDLFYQYDALRHFRDTQAGGGDGRPVPSPMDYVRFEALGLAILLALPRPQVVDLLPDHLRARPAESVVLVDEVDKAPRDLPNDVLNEIDRMQFAVPEADRAFAAPSDKRPIVILTSNSEKSLPAAFLRRCVYCHVPFPDEQHLYKIVEARLGAEEPLPAWIPAAIERFHSYRSRVTNRPATAELLGFLRYLMTLSGPEGKPPFDHPDYGAGIRTLIKTKDDLAKLDELKE